MKEIHFPTHGRRAWRLRRLAAAAAILSFALAAPRAFALPGPTSAVFEKGAPFTVAGYTGSEPLSGFPVLVRIAANSPSGFSYADLHSPTNGDDIAFVGMDGAGLPYEIDTWNPSGTSLIWVTAPDDDERNEVRDVLGLGLGREDRLQREPVLRLRRRLAHVGGERDGCGFVGPLA